MVGKLRELETSRHRQVLIGAHPVDDGLHYCFDRFQQNPPNVAETVDFALNCDGVARDGRRGLDFLHGEIRWQPECKRGSFADLTLHGKVAAHKSSQSTTDGEAEPTSLARPRMARFRLHERIEDRDQFFFGDAGTGVGDAEAHVRPLWLQFRLWIGRLGARDLDRNLAAGRRELHGVGQEIYEDLSRTLVVAAIHGRGLRRRKQIELQTPRRRLRLDERDRRAYGGRR